MSVRSCACLALLFCISARAQEINFDFRRAAGDPEVLEIFAGLMKRYRTLPRDIELAAFLIRGDNGRIACLEWPDTNRRGQQAYRGVRPSGTVAVVHTHPPRFEAKPSPGDVALSVRTGLPIYVLTPLHIYAVDPVLGEIVSVIRNKEWSNSLPRPARFPCGQLKSEPEEAPQVGMNERPAAR